MFTYLTERLAAAGIPCKMLVKSEKVRLLARWSRDFPELLAASRNGMPSANVLRDGKVDVFTASLVNGQAYVLPNDESGMPSLCCDTTAIAVLADVVADTQAGCEEIIFMDRAFGWSCVFVNHGAAGAGKYASIRVGQTETNEG